MLKDEDRIFQNLYNDYGAELESAKAETASLYQKVVSAYAKISSLQSEKRKQTQVMKSYKRFTLIRG